MAKATRTPAKATRTPAKATATTEAKAPKAPKRKTEADLHAKQQACARTSVFWDGKSNIVDGTLRFEETGSHANKQTVEIQTIGVDGTPDGGTRRVATSDLHQVHHSEDVAKEIKKARKAAAAKARRERAAAALALLEAQEAG
jgi:hypothetical protein